MRLSKIAKDLCIGIQTVVDFLEKNGGDLETKWTPMSQVPDDLYELLCRSFHREKEAKTISERDRTERQRVRENINRMTHEINTDIAGITSSHTSVDLEVRTVLKNESTTPIGYKQGIEDTVHSSSANERDLSTLTDSAKPQLKNIAIEDFDWEAYENGETLTSKSNKEQVSYSFYTNEIVKGTVTGINKREVIVNVGYKSEGVIPAAEFRYNPDLKVGDEVEVYIESCVNRAGQLVLSHKRARAVTSWARVNEALESQEVITGFVKCRTKGGMIVDVFGIEAFLPGSQIDVKPIRDYDVFVNKTMEFKVVKINQEYRNVVVSHKILIEEAHKVKQSDLLSQFQKGQEVDGIVKNITSYGVFVDLGIIDGFIHISDLSWDRIKHPKEIVCVGQKIKVLVLDIDLEKERVALGLKYLTPKHLQEDKQLIKDIWTKHTEVQEEILRQRSYPLFFDSESVEIINEKLHLRVLEPDNVDEVKEEIKKALNLSDNDCHFDEGYVCTSIENWSKVDDVTKQRISSFANSEYVSFSFNPVIDGTIVDRGAQFTNVLRLLDKIGIEYNLDKSNRLQIAIEQLGLLKENPDFQNLQISLPDRTSAIVSISPGLPFLLESRYPWLKYQSKVEYVKRRKSNGIDVNRKIEVSGGYLPQSMIDSLNSIYDIFLNQVEYQFILHQDVVGKYDWDKNLQGLPPLIDGTITFTKKVKRMRSVLEVEEEENSETVNCEVNEAEEIPEFRYLDSNKTISDFKLDYTILHQSLVKIFGNNSFDLIDTYTYVYQENKNWATREQLDKFHERVFAETRTEQMLQVSGSGKYIGIDFDWRHSSLFEIIEALSTKYPFIAFDIFTQGHKCNFDIEYKKSDMFGIISELRNLSDDMHVELTKKGTEIVFYREFESIENYAHFKFILTEKLKSFNSNRFQCSLSDIPAGILKLNFFYDLNSRIEDRKEAVKELKGENFKSGDHIIGKLIRTGDYPNLVFDISGDNFESTLQDFDEGKIDQLIPDLAGDLEKMARLKESLSRIVNNNNVANPLLGDFIFDASKAGRITNFEEEMALKLSQIEIHLLNKKIKGNAPQKDAIAKTLLAPDLALIQGPPGTGKSTAIAEIIWQHVRENPQTRILLTSETNLAVDNAIDRIINDQHNLVKPIRIGDESRLESEGLQFSYQAMERWAKGEIEVSRTLEDEEYEDDETEENDEMSEETPTLDKLVLVNWISNIARRADENRMPELAYILWQKVLANPSEQIRPLFFKNYVANCNVVGATCSSIGQKNIIFTEAVAGSGHPNRFVPTAFYKTYRRVFGNPQEKYPKPPIRFDVVIQDESSKATPAELSLPLIYGQKNIIIGDHRQLPPMLSRESFTTSFEHLIKREHDEQECRKIEQLKTYVMKHFKTLEVSHFERLYNQIDPNLKGVFNYQFRMHPAINEVIKQFYVNDGGLRCGLVEPKDLGVDDPDIVNNGASRYHGITAGPITPDVHVLWIDTDSPEMESGTSRVNYGEVDVIEKLLTELSTSDSFKAYLEKFEKLEDKQIGLISFYGRQLRLLSDMSKKFSKADLPIRVSTVDRFQGMERNIIIVSMVRSNCIQVEQGQKPNYVKYGELGYPAQSDLGFAQSPNRLNVALSRAKRLLIIVGNSKLYRRKEIYNNVYATIENHPNGRIITSSEYGL